MLALLSWKRRLEKVGGFFFPSTCLKFSMGLKTRAEVLIRVVVVIKIYNIYVTKFVEVFYI